MFVRYLITVLFALQVASAPWLASASRVAIQADASEDLLLVCTGAEYRWISLSASASSGDFIFVDAPADAPETDPSDHTPTCLLGWLQLDQSLLTQIDQVELLTHLESFYAVVFSAQRQRVFSGYSSRAPPTALIV